MDLGDSIDNAGRQSGTSSSSSKLHSVSNLGYRPLFPPENQRAHGSRLSYQNLFAVAPPFSVVDVALRLVTLLLGLSMCSQLLETMNVVLEQLETKNAMSSLINFG